MCLLDLLGFQGPHRKYGPHRLLSPSSGSEGERGVPLLTATSRILDFNCTHTATHWQPPPRCPPVDPGVDVATAARRGIRMSKCLVLPPPLMDLHPQILFSGSKPRMPHCFWKPPGKKEGQRRLLPAHGTGRCRRSHLPAQGFYTNTPHPGITTSVIHPEPGSSPPDVLRV